VKRYAWAAPGDVNAFCGLALDNIANLVLTVSLLQVTVQFPASFVLSYMIPGTALGVLLGDLWFTRMAFRLARRTGGQVTAMPLGLDTPSTIGMILFVLGPAFLDARARGLDELAAAHFAWRIGMCAMIASGLFKLACALVSNSLRSTLPRAGLLGSLTAIALVLISFLPLLEILHLPIVGILSLAVVLATLVAHLRFPGGIPGALGALLLAMAAYYALLMLGHLPTAGESHELTDLLDIRWPLPTLVWIESFRESLPYLPVVLPFALATVVGGIDCTESAAAAGDEYNAGEVVATEAIATLAAGLCGGVIQTTPYIGHPAYKKMGGRAAYTLATALFIGGAGIFGYFAAIYEFIPRAAIFPILVFVGLEITAQSFRATALRHYPAVALACVPALGYLALIFVDPLVRQLGFAKLDPSQQVQIQTLRVLAGGFILTSLLWASLLASLIDRRLRRAAAYAGVAALFSLFGIIHSPFAGSPMFLPWSLPDRAELSTTLTPTTLATAYLLAGGVFLVWSLLPRGMASEPPLEELAATEHAGQE
jgi:AGZA family xanthine/uracil permease-like MFS transporter